LRFWKYNICEAGWYSTVIQVLYKEWEQQFRLKQLMPIDANPNSAEIDPHHFDIIIIIIIIIII